jgi:hypothetical protein
MDRASSRRSAGPSRVSLRSASATAVSSPAMNSAVSRASAGLAPLPSRAAP